jgi:hypothetical protein
MSANDDFGLNLITPGDIGWTTLLLVFTGPIFVTWVLKKTKLDQIILKELISLKVLRITIVMVGGFALFGSIFDARAEHAKWALIFSDGVIDRQLTYVVNAIDAPQGYVCRLFQKLNSSPENFDQIEQLRAELCEDFKSYKRAFDAVKDKKLGALPSFKDDATKFLLLSPYQEDITRLNMEIDRFNHYVEVDKSARMQKAESEILSTFIKFAAPYLLALAMGLAISNELLSPIQEN